MATLTSFRKKSSSKPNHPQGTRPSLHNAQLLVSTGVPSLDALLGGGIAIGSILLIEEDSYEHYSRVLKKYFMAEGIMCGHSILLGSASQSPDDMINDLPAVVVEDQGASPMPSLAEDEEEEGVSSSTTESKEMTIAWRYRDKPLVQSSFSNQFGHCFDLTKKMDKSRIHNGNTLTFQVSNKHRTASSIYSELKSFIRASITEANSAEQVRVVQRIVLHSLGSPLWLQNTAGNAADLISFMHSLRGIVRGSDSVVLVTVPTHLFQDPAVVKRLERLCDSVVRLEAFEGSERELNPLYKDFHGLFHLVKLPRINTLIAHYPETLDLTFKLKRKRFIIEKLHLPPELSDTVSRPQEDTVKAVKKNLKHKINPSLQENRTSISITSVHTEF